MSIFKKSLDDILKSFERTVSDLAKHIEKKTEEKVQWIEHQKFVEEAVKAIDEEVARAERVAQKVKDLIL